MSLFICCENRWPSLFITLMSFRFVLVFVYKLSIRKRYQLLIIKWVKSVSKLPNVQSGKKVLVHFALYDVKWVLFRWVLGYVKVLPHSCLPDMFSPLMIPLKWGTAWSSNSRGIRIATSQSQKCQKRPTLLSKLE